MWPMVFSTICKLVWHAPGGLKPSAWTTGARHSAGIPPRSGARESALNRFDQFITDIDGLDIHLIHQRSPHDDAFPLVITHG